MAPVLHVVAPCGGIMSVTPQVSSGGRDTICLESSRKSTQGQIEEEGGLFPALPATPVDTV